MVMGFSRWNVRSLYRSASGKAVAMECAKYTLDWVGEQETRWDKLALHEPRIILFSMEKEIKITN
jgi:hypothetical protein